MMHDHTIRYLRGDAAFRAGKRWMSRVGHSTWRGAHLRSLICTTVLLIIYICSGAGLRNSDALEPSGTNVHRSENLMPHFEPVDGRQVFYVDGWPFTILAVEIPWEELVYGRYHETLRAYDKLYPAAQAIGLNTLIVPIKWSMIEPEKDEYDFSYLDHVKTMAETHHLKLVLGWFGHYASNDGNLYFDLTGDFFAPSYIVNDEKSYPRAIDAEGVSYHNAVSYEYDAITERESKAFRAFMEHIKKIDAGTRTILMIQTENEIAVFGGERYDHKLWRDHSPRSNELFAAKGFSSDLKYSAWRLSSNWLRRVTDAGAQAYRLPFYLNFVAGQVGDDVLGGSPGEDVATYLDNCPSLTFVGVDLYLPADTSVGEMRSALARYRVGRNLPALTETNSDRTFVAPRLAYLAIGEFGVPIVAPWALTISYLNDYQPMLLPDGTLANGAFALRDAYTSLAKALPQVSYYGNSSKVKVFMARIPGEKFSESTEIEGIQVKVSGAENGQAIVLHPTAKEIVIVGYRCDVSLWNEVFKWPALKQVHVEKGSWAGNQWRSEGEPLYEVDQVQKRLGVQLNEPQVVRLYW